MSSLSFMVASAPEFPSSGTFDWTRYPNILPAYRGGDARLWGLLQLRKKGLRDLGGTLAATDAHHIAVGAETLALRMARQCENARAPISRPSQSSARK